MAGCRAPDRGRERAVGSQQHHPVAGGVLVGVRHHREAAERAVAGAAPAQVTELLGPLPLLLEQAGAYIRETRLSLVGHLERLQRYLALTVAKGRPRARTDTVATTWQLSLERLSPTPGAVAMLEVCAFLDPEAIPPELRF